MRILRRQAFPAAWKAAAYSKEAEGRLWRLEWAQAFGRLAELGKDQQDRS
jgi:hypothetical protein